MKRDNAKAARALAEAAYSTDAKVCEDHGITLRTLQNWRAALKTDRELSRLFAEAHRELGNRGWADEVDETLSAATQKLRALILGAQSSSPETIQAVTGAIQSLAEIAMTRDMLAARRRDSDPDQPPATAEQPRAVN